jgi:ElaB/YqjD/DUF883 family membrane-anchored ribosome-binding protein
MTASEGAEEQPQGGGNEDSGESSPVLETVKDVVAEAGQQATPIAAEVLLDALFSDTVRQQVLQQAEAGLQDLLDATIEALPDTGAASGLAEELDRTRRKLRSLVRDMVDELFAGSTRAEVEQHVTAAAQQLTEGNSDAAKEEAELAGQTLLSGMLDVIEGHWAQILRIVLAVIVKMLQEAIASHVKDAFAAIAAAPAEAAKEEASSLQDQVKEKAEELRQRLEETRDTIQERVEEAKERLQERVEGGISSAVQGGSRGHGGFGQPPSLRPPAGPGARRPPGRAPAGRPPSRSR